MSWIRVREKHPRSYRAWQNVKGAIPPDWIQGRGCGLAGGPLIITTNAMLPIIVEPEHWIIEGPAGLEAVHPLQFMVHFEEVKP